jgi:phage terminase large subunit
LHKAYFFDNPKNNTVILKTTYQHNRFLDEEYKQVINNLQHEDKMYYNIYGLGEWGVLGNLIYSNWEVISDVPISYDEIIWGLDFGFNNPSALLKIGIKDGNLYLLEEMYKTGLTNQDLIKELRKRIATFESIYADSAEPARIEEIRRAGFRIYPAQKDVTDGLDFVKRQRIFIHKACSNTIKEIQGYKYKEDKDGNVLDEPVKFADHLMDAMRYAIYTHLWRPKTFSLKADII